MSFFNNLKKNLNTAANYTVQKTGEVTETAKIRLDIRSQNVRLSKCFENIGRVYYKNMKESGEAVSAELDAYILEADGIKAEIAVLRRDLAKAQGCVICPACAVISPSSCAVAVTTIWPLAGITTVAGRSHFWPATSATMPPVIVVPAVPVIVTSAVL